jgi:hypothetical protein
MAEETKVLTLKEYVEAKKKGTVLDPRTTLVLTPLDVLQAQDWQLCCKRVGLPAGNTPSEILAQTKSAYQQELQETLAFLQELEQDPQADKSDFWGPRDDQTRIGVCLTLIEQLEDPTQQTAQALEERLRTLFRRVDEIEVALQSLPCLEYLDGDEELLALDAETRAGYAQARTLERECFEQDCQLNLTARFLGVPAWLIRRMRHVMRVSHEDEETKRSCQHTEAANAYPLVKLWMNGTGTIKQLVMPEHISVALWDEENISLVG